MKFVIKSLFFVNLLLQITNSLRKCFDHDQNIMLTIILLAFSLIGIIGLSIGNRFVLIIFAACITLILIASITIYAINKTGEDTMKPKVPYYTTNPVEASESSNQPSGRQSTRKGQQNSPSSNPKSKIKSKARPGSRSQDVIQRISKLTQVNENHNRNNNSSPSLSMLINPNALEESSDEPVASSKGSVLRLIDLQTAGELIPKVEPQSKLANLRSSDQEDVATEQQDSPDRVQNEQWIAYERYLYERYLNMLSQSIDLVMLIILSSWLALLLDEESDQCFGMGTSNQGSDDRRNKYDSSHRSSGNHRSSAKSGQNVQSIYNYNGVRYSIRPDTANESPTRVVVR